MQAAAPSSPRCAPGYNETMGRKHRTAKARRERRTLVFVDESGFYLLPSVVKTYAPRGQTPLVDEWQTSVRKV